MNALTKLFVVLEFICSLLLAAGIVVFVNKTDDFRGSLAKTTTQLETERGNVRDLARQIVSINAANTANEGEKNHVISDLNSKIDHLNQQINEKSVAVAKLESDVKSKDIQLTSLGDAVRASDEMSKGLQAALTTLQQSYGKSIDSVRELNVAIDDLHGKNDRLEKTVQVLEEEKVEKDKQISVRDQALTALGVKYNPDTNEVEKNGQTVVGASGQIVGQISDTNTTGGVRYATISVGTSDNVTKGMKFYVVNGHGEFYGILTIENVQPTMSYGRIDGPSDKVAQIQKGLEVKTQL